MIKDDVLVFDCVAHPFNFDPSNTLGQAGELFNNHLYAFHQVLTPEDEPKLSAEEFLKEWSTEEISRMVFDESDTDMLVAMPLPLTDLFRDGLSPWERCVELIQLDKPQGCPPMPRSVQAFLLDAPSPSA